MFQHEIHHGFISNQNRKRHVSYLSDRDVAGVNPYKNSEERDAWEKQSMKGIKKIFLLLSLLNKSTQPLSKLSRDEKQLWDSFNKIKLNYEPYQHRRYYSMQSNAVNEFFKKGYLNKSHQLRDGGFRGDENYSIQGMSVDVIMRYSSVEKDALGYKFYAHIENLNSVQQTILFDAFVLFVRAIQGRGAGDRITEADAYLHEIFEPYPELFNLLFSELNSYHLNRTTEEFKDCVQRIRRP